MPDVKAMTDALRFYADEANWRTPSTGFAAQYDPALSPVTVDRGTMARIALAPACGVPSVTFDAPIA